MRNELKRITENRQFASRTTIEVHGMCVLCSSSGGNLVVARDTKPFSPSSEKSEFPFFLFFFFFCVRQSDMQINRFCRMPNDWSPRNTIQEDIIFWLKIIIITDDNIAAREMYTHYTHEHIDEIKEKVKLKSMQLCCEWNHVWIDLP